VHLEKLDLKDRKILYHLDLNSRQSFAQIGKKVGLHKDVVAYRVNKLVEKGIIRNFFTVIDSSKLGYISFRLYFTFQYATPEIKKEIINYFINNKYTYFIGLAEGSYDLIAIMWVKDVMDFYSFYEKTQTKYRYYFKEIKSVLYLQLYHYRFSFFLDDFPKKDRELYEVTGAGKPINYDELDFNLLKLIASNARMSTVEIANKLNTTTNIIKYRIKKLKELQVIKGYRITIDSAKIGYKLFKVDIYIKEYKDSKLILNFIRYNPNLIYLNKTVGHADLELEFYVKTIEDVHDIMDELSIKFPGVIKYYTFFNIIDMVKIQLMPDK
jgi:Lrp/AsnC family transcriptional regulator for asnA, asnC and gidA